MQLLERLGQELSVLGLVVLWVMLRALGVVQLVLKNGKNLRVQVLKREIIHLDQAEGNLNLEVLPIEKNISVKVEENKCSHTLQENGKTQVIEESDTQKITNLTLSNPTEKPVSSRKKASEYLKREKEVNTNGTST